MSSFRSFEVLADFFGRLLLSYAPRTGIKITTITLGFLWQQTVFSREIFWSADYASNESTDLDFRREVQGGSLNTSAKNPLPGRASDLGPGMSLSWPLNQPYSCPELRSTLEESTRSAALKLKAFCNIASRKMEEEGFPRCMPDLCPVSSQGNSVIKELGSLQASFSYYPDFRGVVVSVTYSFPERDTSGSPLACFDPMLTAFEVVQSEVDAWTFSKFAALCVHDRTFE